MKSESAKTLVLQVGVKVLLRDAKGNYLLLHRSPEKYPGTAGTWDIPGGRINPGTSLLENLKREVKEETGLSVVGEPKLIAAQDILRGEKHVVRLTYVGEASGEVQLDTEENDSFEWSSKEEMKENADLDVFLKEVLIKNSF